MSSEPTAPTQVTVTQESGSKLYTLTVTENGETTTYTGAYKVKGAKKQP